MDIGSKDKAYHMDKKIGTRNIVITGLLLALEIVFQIAGNYLQIGLVNVNLTLVTVILGAVLCGPLYGAILGFFNGIMALFSPSTLATFMPINPAATVLICFLKCTLAGVAAGYVYKLLKNKNKLVALIVASILVPIINTGIFAIGSLIFFRSFLESGISEKFPNIGAFLIFGIILWNFIFEFASSLILGPSIGMILLKREEKTATQQ